MFLWIGGIVLGVFILGYLYYRYTPQTVAVIDETANAVNTVITDVKDKLGSNTAVANTKVTGL